MKCSKEGQVAYRIQGQCDCDSDFVMGSHTEHLAVVICKSIRVLEAAATDCMLTFQWHYSFCFVSGSF